VTRPNVLLVHCHDLGRFLGCYGVPTLRTPHLDSLAADGVLFSRAFCVAPQCSPSRASLFTGRYPQSHGVLGLTHSYFAWDLRSGERHLARELNEVGYRTTLLGIHHESRTGDPDRIATQLGFDEVDTRAGTDHVTNEAIARLNQASQGGQPFYLQVGYAPPHRTPRSGEFGYMGFRGNSRDPDAELGVTIPPYLIDDEPGRQEIAELQGAVHHLDEAVGRVLAALRENGLDDHTIVVFTTDHGLALPRAKCTLYDPGLEIAMIMRCPARGWVGGQVHDALLSNIDVFPTLLEAVEVPVRPEVAGRSFINLLDGRASAAEQAATSSYQFRDAIYAQITHHDYYDPRRCVRTATHKLIVNFSSAPAFMDPSQSWKRRTTPKIDFLSPDAYHPPIELYDLDRDPVELHNLADDPTCAGLRDELIERLRAWMEETADPILAGPVVSPLHNQAVELLGVTTPGRREASAR
jgi:N-sulfoglucosamine sulfohydrolase